MALAYVPPGVTVEESIQSSVSPLLAANALICLVGVARGYYLEATTRNLDPVFSDKGPSSGGSDTPEAFVLTAPVGTTFVPVSGTQTFESVRSFTDASAGSADNGYEQDTDFKTKISTDKRSIEVGIVTDGPMDTDSGVLVFTYRIIPDKYFAATRIDSMDLVNKLYGPAWKADGTINTPLSAAAHICFQNGAQNLVIQPLYRTELADPNVRLQPVDEGSDGLFTDSATWDTTLQGIRDIEDINIVVPIVGQGQSGPVTDAAEFAAYTSTQVFNVFCEVQDYIWFMAQQGQLVIGIFGEDSSTDVAVATATELRDHGEQLRQRLDGRFAEQSVLISPSRFQRPKSNIAGDFVVGGQYVAAAVAGMLAARTTTTPLTRKPVVGFSGVTDPRDKANKNADAQAGLMVIEQKGGVIQVRHGITLDNTASARRELSVVRAKHRMIESIRDTLESQIIGEVPADGNAPGAVRNAVIGVLELLRDQLQIIDYSDVTAQTVSDDPTVVECRFSYRPAFPLNYVHIVFNLDLSAADITSFDEFTIA